MPTKHATNGSAQEEGYAEGAEDLLPLLVETLALMKKTETTPEGALSILMDGLRQVQALDERAEEAQHLPCPAWLYGH